MALIDKAAAIEIARKRAEDNDWGGASRSMSSSITAGSAAT